MNYPPWLKTKEERARWDKLTPAQRQQRLLSTDRHKRRVAIVAGAKVRDRASSAARYADATYRAQVLERNRIKYRTEHGLPLEGPLGRGRPIQEPP